MAFLAFRIVFRVRFEVLNSIPPDLLEFRIHQVNNHLAEICVVTELLEGRMNLLECRDAAPQEIQPPVFTACVIHEGVLWRALNSHEMEARLRRGMIARVPGRPRRDAP